MIDDYNYSVQLNSYDDMNSHFEKRWLIQNVNHKIECIIRKNVDLNSTEIQEIKTLEYNSFLAEEDDETRNFIYCDEWYLYINNVRRTLVFKYRKTEESLRIKSLIEKIEFSEKSQVRWWFTGLNGMEDTTIDLLGNSPIPEFYPWIDNLNQFYTDFSESSSNVLILIGPPGTGKTSFIRGLIRHTQLEAWVTYDAKIQTSEQLYTNFMTERSQNEKGKVLIMEDADEMLAAREDGNKMMSRILGVSDGLISLNSRKLIFSTNIPSISHIDDALLRPGRCFAAVQFRSLNVEESNIVLKTMGYDKRIDSGNHTLSSILNSQYKMSVRKIGFN